jgi:polyvinyl alcohol dehydrogenase (cytochrome)
LEELPDAVREGVAPNAPKGGASRDAEGSRIMYNPWLVRLLVTVAIACLSLPAVAQSVGELLYKRNCAGCHELSHPNIPPRESLAHMSAARILRSLEFGTMLWIAAPLRRSEREAVASFLASSAPTEPPTLPPSARCAATDTAWTAAFDRPHWNGWSASPSNTRFQPAAMAQLSVDQTSRLQLKWAFGYEGDVTAPAAPVVLGGRVFVGSAGGDVQALEAASGCLHWTFQSEGPVRAPLVAGRRSDGAYSLFFGDCTGNFYALDAATGRLLWKRKLDDHDAARITGAALLHAGKLFVPVASSEEPRAVGPQYPCCTFRGSLVALNQTDGAVVWKSYTIPEAPKPTSKNKAGAQMWGPSGAGIWAAPTLDNRKEALYVATGNNYSSPATDASDAVLAFDLNTGRLLWARQVTPADAYNSSCFSDKVSCPQEDGPDHDFASSPMLIRLSDGRRLLVIGQKSGVVWGLDPDRKGAIVWQRRIGRGGVWGGVQWGMAADDRYAYAALSDVRFTRRAKVDPADPRRRDLNPKEGGGLFALRLSDGGVAWQAPPAAACGDRTQCSPAQSAAVTAIPGVVFSGSVDGHFRAYSSETGQLLWDFDTVRPFQTVNGVKAAGGSLDGPGAVVAGGMVFVNSGYARNNGMPGNVLLAFAP